MSDQETTVRAEQRLRNHIRQVMVQAGLELTPEIATEIENQIIALFRDYGQAPEETKDEVYARGEERILDSLHRTAHR